MSEKKINVIDCRSGDKRYVAIGESKDNPHLWERGSRNCYETPMGLLGAIGHIALKGVKRLRLTQAEIDKRYVRISLAEQGIEYIRR